MINTPVLFIVFNRVETTRQVFEAIRKAQPRQLFVAADGPRNRPGEAELCEQVRQIATQVDWECKVHTLFREKNVGCGRGPADAITWFFDHVEQGIILEDDCLPSQSFFAFCEELLNKYKDDIRIQSISGSNLLKEWNRNNKSYLFSVNSGIWGWATWRRAWKDFDFNATKWRCQEVRELFHLNVESASKGNVYAKALDQTVVRNGEVSWWDYQWMLSRIINSSFGIVPKVNLISNIGFGVSATHTFDINSQLANLPIGEISFPLQCPEAIMIDKEYDLIHSEKFYPSSASLSIRTKLKNRIKAILKA